MRKLLCLCIIVLAAAAWPSTNAVWAQDRSAGWSVLLGTDTGLYSLTVSAGPRQGLVTSPAKRLWGGGSVRKILRIGGTGASGASAWILLTDAGVEFSTDLRIWQSRNQGLPIKTIKLYKDGQKSFLKQVQQIKDLEIDPGNPAVLVCATRDEVYLSRDQGRSWTGLGSPPFRTNGLKAVAAAELPGKNGKPGLTVFVSHSVYGVWYRRPNEPGSSWIDISAGLEKLESTDNADEVSDIQVEAPAAWFSKPIPRIVASQTFRRRIYELDWNKKSFKRIWSDDSSFGTVDSLNFAGSDLRFVREGAVEELDKGAPRRLDAVTNLIQSLTGSLKGLKPACIAASPLPSLDPLQLPEKPFNLSELWLLDEPKTIDSPAWGKYGLYLPATYARTDASLAPFLSLMKSRDLNMIVLDMKDDFGRLRFEPRNEVIIQNSHVFRPVDIDSFLKKMKSKGIYTIARIVCFKDPVLAKSSGGKYAIWDRKANKPWQGLHPDGTAYNEHWVDPYSGYVWDYLADIACELSARGFDEIQFDYIRFPTDGVNLGNAQFRWRDPGMDKDSAIISFLRHIRSRYKGPLSVDIYGANGWYRTAARTGQEVEMLAPWVDIICPMYYPSHFEQSFLAQAPAEMRPYRIYFLGTQRTERIARGRCMIRPFGQAFYLNVSYDRKYYNGDYVMRQLKGLRDAGGSGLTWWNNSARYADIPAEK
jgi:hypothetical protein